MKGGKKSKKIQPKEVEIGFASKNTAPKIQINKSSFA